MRVLSLLPLIALLTKVSSDKPVRNYASELYYASSHGKLTENFVISPFAIRASLSPIYMGALNETKDELKNGLHITCHTKKELAQKMHSLLIQSETQLNGSLYFANGIIINKNFPVFPRFRVLGSKYLQSDLASMNFSPEKAENNAKAINKWIKYKTKNHIENIVEPSSLLPSTSIWVLDATYFKPKWGIPFDINTEKVKFRPSLGKKVQVNMIHNKNGNVVPYGFVEDLNSHAVELPFENQNLRILIILPLRKNGLNIVTAKLKHKKIRAISAKLNKTNVYVQLPKFKIEYGTSLKRPLELVGIKQIFSKPDLSSISPNQNELRVSDVTHKAVIDIDEKSAEQLNVARSQTSTKPPQKFIVDHPFFFAIKTLKTIYLTGHVAKI